MKILWVLSLFAGMVQAVQCQQQQAQIPSAKPAATAATTAPTPLAAEKQIRKTVAFIHMVCANGTGVLGADGTRFFVLYQDKRLGEGGFYYLVTNRHVAECWDEDHPGVPNRVVSVTLKVNLNEGGASEQVLNPNGNVAWVLPTDPSVDLAVLPLMPDLKTVDFLPIPLSSFSAEGKIAEGDRVML